MARSGEVTQHCRYALSPRSNHMGQQQIRAFYGLGTIVIDDRVKKV